MIHFQADAKFIADAFFAAPLCIAMTVERPEFSITISRPEAEAEKARKEGR